MVEVKADALETSFDELEHDDAGMSLRDELNLLKARIADGVIAGKRPALDGVKSAESSMFVEGYLRRGMDSALEAKSVDNSLPGTGGYAIPREIDEEIDRTLVAISPIRAIANVVKVGSSNYRKLITTGGTPSGWVGFEAARPETATPTFSEVVPATGELYANPAASQHMLDDAMFDVESWLATEIANEFARAESAAFIKGTGVNQPLGFLSSPNATTADDSRPIGTLQTVGTGTQGAFPNTNPADKLIDLVQSLRQPYRQGAVFVMNSATAAMIRKFKTTDGAFIWQPGMVAGQAATLLGYPVIEAEDMPDVAANSLSIAFGNFKAGYIIAERAETTILRDPYTKKPYVYFYATQLLELLVQPIVDGPPANDSPASPQLGQQFLVGSAPAGAWGGSASALACWTTGGWRYVRPFEGLAAFDRISGLEWRYIAGAWQQGVVRTSEVRIGEQKVLGEQQGGVQDPVGGNTVDGEARLAISAILTVLREHGLIAT